MAVLSNGRRCPNAAIPGSTYCGLPQHQALSRFDTSQVAILGDLSDAEMAILADPDADQGQVDEIVARAAANFVEEAEEAAAEESVVDEIVDEAIAEEEAEEASEDPVEAELAEEAAEEAATEAEEATGGGTAENGTAEDAGAPVTEEAEKA
jgi:N utilization substance protein A